MSTTTDLPEGVTATTPAPPPPGAVPVYTVTPPEEAREQRIENIIVYGHSNLFYWWPVWLASFALAAWTYLDGFQMAVVPPDATLVRGAVIEGMAEPRDALVAPAERSFALAAADPADAAARPGMTVARSNTLGVIFVATLFLVALVSTLTLRGLVSVVVVVSLIAVVVVLALFNLWDDILGYLGGLDVRMNAAGYLAVGVPLFLAWLFVFFIYDRQRFLFFDEGQIHYVLEIGDSAMVAQAERATVEKKRDDLFRHMLLGFGSGDIVVRTGNGQKIELENVMNVAGKMRVIEYMLRHKPVVAN